MWNVLYIYIYLYAYYNQVDPMNSDKLEVGYKKIPKAFWDFLVQGKDFLY